MGIQRIKGNRIGGKEFSDVRKGKRKPKKSTPVQKLYETCKEVFANCGPGVVPEPSGIERLKAVLDSMTEADVGLRPNMPFFKAKETKKVPKITYLHLYECDNFSIGIFCLPPTGVIPLHNHPGMTVFSKLLFGEMHIKSFDWVDAAPFSATQNASPSDAGLVVGTEVRLAKVKVNADFSAPKTSILYPADGGNMHSFTAVTPCAVLDVLGPPYSDPEGRHCTYYLDFPYGNFSADGMVPPAPGEDVEDYAWLQEREKPEGFAVVGATYSGPKIVPD